MRFRRSRASWALVAVLAAVATLAPSSASGRPTGRPEIERFDINAPLVDFLYTIVGGETFTVTLTIDRPAPAGGTRVRVRKLRDSGPIYTLPKEAVIPGGSRSIEIPIETLPVAPRDITPSNQQLSASVIGGNTVLFGSVFVVPRPAGDPRGHPITHEAEDATLVGARVVSDPDSLASGEAWIEYTSPTGSAGFTVQADRSGEHLLIFRYAYFGFEPRRMCVTVNGTGQRFIFSPTPGEDWYQLTALRTQLRAGANTVRVSAVRRSEPVNLDFIQTAVP